MGISHEQIQGVLGAAAEMRYKHFISRVVDRELVWFLEDCGWAIAEDDDGSRCVPVWPDREYAELCAVGLWSGYTAASIALEEFIDELLGELNEGELGVAVFPTPFGQGVIVELSRLENDLSAELMRV